MESKHHGPRPLRPTSPAMPFVGCPHTNGCGGPGRMLLREMLWQLEQRALQVQEEEFQYCISRGILGYRHPPAYPSLLALIPAAEHRQLERLCGRIPPSHTAIVLSRLHDLMAHNDIPPWELVGVFKQVLRDFLRRQEDGIRKRPAPSAPSTILSAPSPPTEKLYFRITEQSLA
ncbi:protein RD3-like isoform X2 [Carassius gibelio]|uniref:protein RD3-like isoform X2 n=1 Tax=Carassius gibelio TaxID=101364 RepID=UPI00227824E5|nr:protein RD3-like isoform X2 [Carassius gibelio]